MVTASLSSNTLSGSSSSRALVQLLPGHRVLDMRKAVPSYSQNGLWSSGEWLRVLFLNLSSAPLSGQIIISEPQFPHLEEGIATPSSACFCKYSER